MNPSSIPILITRRNRGGSFFTMLVFVMMLVSTGLMYYYFQRTRSLERQVVALQNGEIALVDSRSGFLGFLGLGEKKPLPSVLPSGTPAATAATSSVNNPESVKPDNPVSRAASTPKPGESDLEEEQVTNTEDNTTQPETFNASEEMIGSEPEDEADPDPAEADADVDTEKPGEKQNLESMYDAQPPVRVRAPERDGR